MKKGIEAHGVPQRLLNRQWDATAVADAPRPQPIAVLHEANAPAPVDPGLVEPVVDAGTEAPDRSTTNGLQTETDPETSAIEKITGSISHPAATGSRKLRVYSNGVVNIDRTLFSLTKRMSGRTVVAAWGQEAVMFANTDGEVIGEYAWP